MPVEIERKFLVASDAWREAVQGAGVPMRQGYLSAPGPEAPNVRVRLAGERAFITIKGPGGLRRAEFEYPIPPADAEELLTLCRGETLHKTRWTLNHKGHLWTVDEYHAPARLAGLLLAEVEMEAETVSPPLPHWLGEEVTGDPRWSNAALAGN